MTFDVFLLVSLDDCVFSGLFSTTVHRPYTNKGLDS